MTQADNQPYVASVRAVADALAGAIEAFMRGDGHFADQMAEAMDAYYDHRRLAVSERMLNEPDYGPHPVLDELTRMAQEDGFYG